MCRQALDNLVSMIYSWPSSLGCLMEVCTKLKKTYAQTTVMCQVENMDDLGKNNSCYILVFLRDIPYCITEKSSRPHNILTHF